MKPYLHSETKRELDINLNLQSHDLVSEKGEINEIVFDHLCCDRVSDTTDCNCDGSANPVWHQNYRTQRRVPQELAAGAMLSRRLETASLPLTGTQFEKPIERACALSLRLHLLDRQIAVDIVHRVPIGVGGNHVFIALIEFVDQCTALCLGPVQRQGVQENGFGP